jgi:hypothetical protein
MAPGPATIDTTTTTDTLTITTGYHYTITTVHPTSKTYLKSCEEAVARLSYSGGMVKKRLAFFFYPSPARHHRPHHRRHPQDCHSMKTLPTPPCQLSSPPMAAAPPAS